MRSLVNKVFTPRAIQAQEGVVREKITHHLSRVDPAGFDMVADFSALFPVEVITAMLGVPRIRPPERSDLDRNVAATPARPDGHGPGRTRSDDEDRRSCTTTSFSSAAPTRRRHDQPPAGGRGRARGRHPHQPRRCRDRGVLHAARRRGRRDGGQSARHGDRGVLPTTGISGQTCGPTATRSPPRSKRFCVTRARSSTTAATS